MEGTDWLYKNFRHSDSSHFSPSESLLPVGVNNTKITSNMVWMDSALCPTPRKSSLNQESTKLLRTRLVYLNLKWMHPKKGGKLGTIEGEASKGEGHTIAISSPLFSSKPSNVYHSNV